MNVNILKGTYLEFEKDEKEKGAYHSIVVYFGNSSVDYGCIK